MQAGYSHFSILYIFPLSGFQYVFQLHGTGYEIICLDAIFFITKTRHFNRGV